MDPNKDIRERKPVNLASEWAPMPSMLHTCDSPPPAQPSSPTYLKEKILEGFPKYQTHTKLSVHSALTQEEAYWHLLKCFPTPTGIELFEILLEEWGKPTEEKTRFQKGDGKPTQQNKPLWVVGNAGTGKTSLLRDTAALIFGRRYTDPEGKEINPEPLFISVGGKNLDELLVSKVFGAEGRRFIEDLQERFNTNNLSQGTKKYIQEELRSYIEPESGLLQLQNATPHPETLEKLKTLAEFEGIPLAGSTLGIHLVEGPLIQACREGRLLILDEMDKCLPGTGRKLNEVLLTISGNTREKYFFEEGPVRYCFGPDSIHNNFSLVCSSNNANDTSEPNEFHRSYLDRWRLINIPDPSLDDLSIRLAQTLLGINPLPLLSSPLHKHAHEIVSNLAQRNGHALTEEQTLLLKRLPKTLLACRQIAAMGLLWAEKLGDFEGSEDPILLANEKNLPPVGVRYMQELLQSAQAYQQVKLTPPEAPPTTTPLNQPAQTFLSSLQQPPQTPEYIPSSLGERIEILTQKLIRRLPIGPETQCELISAAILCGVLPEADEENNENPNRLPLVRTLLDTLEEEVEVSPATLELHQKLSDLLVQKNPSLANANKEQIIPPVDLQKLINELSQEKNKNHIICLNDQYLKEKNGRPLQLVPIKPLAQTPKKNLPHFLIDTEELESLLHHPQLKKTILENLWEKPASAENPEETSLSLTDAFQKGTSTIQLCKILSNPPKRPQNTEPIPTKTPKVSITLLLHNQEKNQGVAYNPSFKQTQKTPGLLITNSSKDAQEAIQTCWDYSELEDITMQLYAINNPIEKPSETKTAFFEKIATLSQEPKQFEKLIKDVVNPNLPAYLEIGVKSPLKNHPPETYPA